MANLTRNFTKGKMNKSVDERILPQGEYLDALNIRMGSTENSEIGVVSNSKGNTKLTGLTYNGYSLSSQARCLGAFEDGADETIYWMVHDPGFESPGSPATGIVDMIVSYDVKTLIVTYHVISVNDGGNLKTTLNFNPEFLFTGIDKIENLLFFTDNYNPPRKINVTKNYPSPTASFIDGFAYNDILVIKQPPISSPEIKLIKTGNEDNYLEERFICFAYRYKYDDDEYSATSQWSEVAFIPKPFLFSPDSYLNEGMVNAFNTAEVTFNTGGPLVLGIDLLFKDANSPIIKVIEKLVKTDQGYSNNQEVTYSFSNSKIFTILPESEILRLYDNVPRFARAETLMGNRLIYGNYVEGYNLIDYNNNPVRFDYRTEKVQVDFGEEEVEDTFSSGQYSIQGAQTIGDSVVDLNLAGLDLVQGSSLAFSFSFEHVSWNGDTPLPTADNPTFSVDFAVTLPSDYASVYEFATSDFFVNLIGSTTTIKPVSGGVGVETSCDGTTMTDIYNCQPLQTIDAYTKYDSGISLGGQPINIISTPGSSEISFQFPAVQYADDIDVPTKKVTEYFKISFTDVSYQKVGSGVSLHSNRGYEVGIVYMDEFNRATPALVSQYNTEFFGCSSCSTKNSINVNIPTTQIAPVWATNYKFAIKPDKESYETIYANVYFTNPETGMTFFLLEGENSQKITDGQRLIVKADSDGPARRCIFTTVLGKNAEAADFFELPSDSGAEDDFVPIPAGTYMRLKANNFSAEQTENAIVQPGRRSTTADRADHYPLVRYPLNLAGTDPNNPGYTYVDYTVPAGSRIIMEFDFERQGGGDGNNSCEKRTYKLELTLTASQDYDNFMDWWNGDNVSSQLDSGVASVGGDGCDIENEYINTLAASQSDIPQNLCTNYYRFYRNTTTNELMLLTRGTRACETASWRKNRRSKLKVDITVFRAENTIIFESEPLDAAPDIWYEGSQNFGIVTNDTTCQVNINVAAAEPNALAFNYRTPSGQVAQVIVEPDTASVDGSVDVIAECGTVVVSSSTPPVDPLNVQLTSLPLERGSHLANVQNQVLATGQQGVVSLDFSNCFSFGNGTESYKVRDSLLGKDFNLGNRVTSTSDLDYEEVRRSADLTYSGIYNDESNVNRLNEFNGGLLNFKPLEESFGPVNKLWARETDILCLQEDKISYVLAGKNILTDAGGGSTLLSVPEVLGTQVARVEEYGISNNPESFVVYGADRYFTDAKRGVVIQLKGSSYQSDALADISRQGMRTWFRDLFNGPAFTTQKLGGFDPYMDEYVLTSNTKELPIEVTCENCGIDQEITFVSGSPYQICVNAGNQVGAVKVGWTLSSPSPVPFNVELTYNGTTYTALNQTTSGDLSFNKNLVNVNDYTIKFTAASAGSVTCVLNGACPAAQDLTLIEVCVTNANDSGLFIHNEHRYIDGTYVSALTSNQVEFSVGTTNPVISTYRIVAGVQGVGSIPTNGSNVTLAFNKFGNDDVVFNENLNKFRYLRSSTNYPNTPSAVSNLLQASTAINTNITSAPSYYSGTFQMPAGVSGDYLYIIYDYRTPTELDLCFSAESGLVACCDCSSIPPPPPPPPPPGSTCYLYTISTTSGSGIPYTYTDCDGVESGGSLGGASGTDQDSFCALEGTVNANGMSLFQGGECPF
jgi:hypothetical protein